MKGTGHSVKRNHEGKTVAATGEKLTAGGQSFDARVLAHLRDHLEDTIRNVAKALEVSKSKVGRTKAWKTFAAQKRTTLKRVREMSNMMGRVEERSPKEAENY